MQRALWLGGCLWAGSAYAQTVAGTKRDPIGPQSLNGSPTGVMPLVQLLLALAIVFVLIRYLLPKVVAKAGKRLVTKVGSPIKVEESASFGGGMLYVVEARNKTLLLSVGAQGVSCLADLTPSGRTSESAPTFAEMLDAQPENLPAPFTAAATVPEEPATAVDDLNGVNVREALARLRKIVD